VAIAPRLPELDFEAMSAEDLLLWGYEEYGEKLCLTCSWQKQSSVLVHMVSELGLGIPVIELDTQLFFRESYETRDRLVERYGLKLESPQVITVAEQHKREGPNLWETDPDRCCHIRKVEPLLEALGPYDAEPSDDAEAAMVGALRGLEVPPARRLGREEGLGLHPGQRDSVQPAARIRVPLDRLHPVHPPD
jgi:3'-phosphoadenosine 5'-phosphosulfate sulfotransferase (PAPS reductase)/FAD synthetase